ncbi:MAG TPA: Gmad2 immunoglobulin-like domain-containing protein [Intrasporangium sp.]|uniref:Gmad2 immunoglobulin-like domain-containing protein n=1 Tax=Intrasporangium sp. TaxID=1925024 RepID=UPI002D77CD98|nr:Gmad2 immunoglobulin-like domain-containing protein [Intrasporangium sp.]HET7397298.1 Gmad2 immunoglobulin-like domain-containing protein [Intrasporangium sp.]
MTPRHSPHDGRDRPGADRDDAASPREGLGTGTDGDIPLIGEALGPLERRLRAGLTAEADTITPHHRLDAILAAAHASEGAGRASAARRWLAPAAAAAAVAAIAVGIWATNRPPEGSLVPTAPTRSTSQPPTPTPTGSTSVPTATATTSAPTATGSASPSAPPPPTPGVVQLPVYFTGPLTAGSARHGLFREFTTATTAPADKALAAVQRAMQVPPGASYRDLWRGRQALAVTASATAITVHLSGPADTATAAEGRFAVQQLVWTATAAVGRGNLPVTFVVDGSTLVATGQPSSRAYIRPTSEIDVATLLAPLWVDSPARGQRLTAGTAVKVSGQASTFEANVQWEVLRGTTSVATGSTTASAGAPARGGFSFSAPALPAGAYVVRVFEVSMANGSLFAEQRIPITVG